MHVHECITSVFIAVIKNKVTVFYLKVFSFYLKLARCIHRLSGFAEQNKSIPTLGYTHFQ